MKKIKLKMSNLIPLAILITIALLVQYTWSQTSQAPSLVARAKPQRIAPASVVLWGTDEGEVYSSGEAEYCRGDASEGHRTHFEKIEGLEKIISVVQDSYNNAAALDKDGQVWVWGYDWSPIVHGEEVEGKKHVPARYEGLEEIAMLDHSDVHLVALGRDGRVRTVGISYNSNEMGQLGTGATKEVEGVVVIPGIDDAVAVSANSDRIGRPQASTSPQAQEHRRDIPRVSIRSGS